ncbi:ABC transporter ATP-binding protein [Pleionea sediminis]|uniref:ABC transporter ATP-binding protein n=1 Tax=Pleionea sediminis TaxID=2569479 RepID=UPI001184C2B7|nr:ABC transporter ATP-binding protein [Pleionea sediminis]
MEKLIEIKDVDKVYGDKVVLDNIDLNVSKGELCTLVGPSGCGKSTLLRLILGMERATRGEVIIEGKNAPRPNKQRGIVFQKYSLFPNLSVFDNVLLAKRMCQSPWASLRSASSDEKDEAMEYLKRVRLEHARDKKPHELSGGMQQRAAIAQALITKPPVLLMDEPFGALDPNTREELQVFLTELWEENNLTIFFVTHDLEEAVFLGTRLLVLSQYYTDDRGDGFDGRGGKIVFDKELKFKGASTEIKDTDEFKKLIKSIKEIGFEPRILQHVKDFNLTHPDSYQTLTEIEHRNSK